MTEFDNLTIDDTMADEEDVIRTGYTPLDSGTYSGTIKLAFITYSRNEAMGFNLHIDVGDGRTLKQQFWLTSGKDKGKKNYYVTPEGRKKYLPDFNTINSMCRLLLSKDLPNLSTEEKVIKLYDFTMRKEIDTKVKMYMDLLGLPIICGVIKQITDMRSQVDGKYVPNGKTYTGNIIDKFFNADGFTLTEMKAKLDTPVFKDQWEEKYKGTVIDKSTPDVKPIGSTNKPKTVNKAQSLFA